MNDAERLPGAVPGGERRLFQDGDPLSELVREEAVEVTGSVLGELFADYDLGGGLERADA